MMETKQIIEKAVKYFNCDITGSFKFYLLGLLEKYNDIDIITTADEKPKIIEFIKDFGFYQAYTTKYQQALNDHWCYVHKWSEETKEKNRNEKVYFDYFTNGRDIIHFVLVKKVENINDYDILGEMYKRGTQKDLKNIVEICNNKLKLGDDTK